MNSNGLLIDDDGRSTKRGVRMTKAVIPLMNRLFARCESAREVRDLRDLVEGDVSVASSLRLLGLMIKKHRKNKAKD